MWAAALVGLMVGGPWGACLLLAAGITAGIKSWKVDAEYARRGEVPPSHRLIDKLVSKAEGGGLIRELKPATVDLARLVNGSLSALPQADLVAQCVTHTILPTGDVKIQDGQFTSDEENYKEFWYSMVGLSGESQNFDGNGHYVRFAVGGGSQTISTGKYGGANGAKLYSNVNNAPLGTRPAYPGKRSPYNHTAACKDQKLPDLNGAKTGPADGSPEATSGVISNTASQTPATTASVATTTRAAKGDDLTTQLIDRLNPFRTGSGR